MPYEVQTSVFEGPFDLLLHLILREQVDLYEISLVRIVDAYLAEIERMEHLDLELTTEFLLIAATLVELKCRRLLPDDGDVDIDDEFALWEERDVLIARLLDCKTFKDVASAFAHLLDEATLSFPRRTGPDERFSDLVPDILEGVTPVRLQRAYFRATQRKVPLAIDLYHVNPIRANVGEALVEMLRILPNLGRTTFRDLTAAIADRIEVVVRFLALLELFKQGRVDLTQIDRFGDITVEWVGGEDRDFEAALAIDDYEG